MEEARALGREHRCAGSGGGGKRPFRGRWPFAEEWFPLSQVVFFWLGHFLPHPRRKLKSIMVSSSAPGGGKIK